MSGLSNLRRLALLLALLPQLLVLGLQSGLVVCIAPGGHVQVEFAKSACCDPTGPASAGGSGELASSVDEPDCGSCSDLRIALDLRLAGGPDMEKKGELPAHGAAIPPESARIAPATYAVVSLGRMLAAVLEPPHLIHLRSVVLRC